MTTAESFAAVPRLLKERQLHSRIFAVIVAALLLVGQPWLSPAGFLGQLMLWAGYALVIAGVLGRIYCAAYIGGRKNDTVVRDGPFSIVRNPLYVFSFLAVVGIGLQSGTLTLTVLLIVAFAMYYPMVVEKEEMYLRHKFGAQYEAYMREVPRWRPNFQLWSEPEEIPARPRFLRRTIMDALVFFLPMPGFYLLTLLHAHRILPVWLILP